MKIEKVATHIKNIPCMSAGQGTIIYDLILNNKINNILELGTAHGTGSCYMAAALDEIGSGKITTIDNRSALKREPNVIELTKKCGLDKYVNPIFANTTYNWELMKLIEQQTKNGQCEPIFDFCYLDGAHNFEIDCCAFFLIDKLLKTNGLILFDDLNWSYAASPSLKNSKMVNEMSDDEKTTPHIKKLVELIVLQNPNYHQASVAGDWFLIRKKDITSSTIPNKINLGSYDQNNSIFSDVKNILKKVKNKFKH